MLPLIAVEWIKDGDRDERAWVGRMAEASAQKLGAAGLIVSSVIKNGDPKRVLVDEVDEFGWRGERMDWRVFITTFGVIFLAEMGDKTQLAAMTLSAQTKRPWAVLIGASLALACVSAIGVVVGGVLSQYLPLEWIKRAAAIAFIVIGALILLGKF